MNPTQQNLHRIILDLRRGFTNAADMEVLTRFIDRQFAVPECLQLEPVHDYDPAQTL